MPKFKSKKISKVAPKRSAPRRAKPIPKSKKISKVAPPTPAPVDTEYVHENPALGITPGIAQRMRASGQQRVENRDAPASKEKSGIWPDNPEWLQQVQELSRKIRPTSGISRFGDTFSKLYDQTGPNALPHVGDFQFPLGSTDTSISASASADAKKATIKGAPGFGAPNFVREQPFFHTPGNAEDAYNLPKSYIEQIRVSRLMFNLGPWINAITRLKAYYGLSKFSLTTPEPFVSEFMTQQSFNSRFNLYTFLGRMSLSIRKFGEAPVWGGREIQGKWPKTGKPIIGWSHFVLLEPELIEIKKNYFGSESNPEIYLRPSKDLAELVRRMDEGDPDIAPYSDRIPENFKNRIRNRELVPLDPETASVVADLTDGSATRGTPPYQSLFTTYFMEDFARLGNMARVQRYHFPFEVWSIGDLANKIKPTLSDIRAFQTQIEAAQLNFPASIFVPPIVKYEAVSAGATAMSTKEDYDYIWKCYTVGLGVSEQILLGESSIFSSTETSSNQAFIRARKRDRDELVEWMQWKFYEPLSRWNNLTIKKGGILAPIVPEIDWDKVLDYEQEARETETRKYLHDKGMYPSPRFIRKTLRENPEEIGLELQQEVGGVYDDGKRIAAPEIRRRIAQGMNQEKTDDGSEGAGQSSDAATPIPQEGENLPAPEMGKASTGKPTRQASKGGVGGEPGGEKKAAPSPQMGPPTEISQAKTSPQTKEIL
jgi:hypothetical protein